MDAHLGLLTDLLDVVPGERSYAEARWVRQREESIAFVNERLERVDDEEAEGIGVRVRLGSSWGFAATRVVSSAGAREALRRAIEVARAQPSSPAIQLPALERVSRGHWSGPCAVDPFSLALEDRLALLSAAEAALRGDERIVRTRASCRSALTEKALATTDGVAVSQTLRECGGGVAAIAVAGEELQVRSYPSAHAGGVGAGGYELLLALELETHAPRVAEEAVALLSAPPCPSGRTTLVLGSEQLALQVHESIGHALELDRMLLGEASYAGTSWVTPADIGALRYGSDLLHVTADATLPGALGSFGWDDEGAPASRMPLIEAGMLRAALSDRTSAAAAGLDRSGGCSRADGFARQPIVRMTNVSIEPGDAGTLADLIAATDEGVYMETNRSWSIDDRRLHFQFATEVAHEIRGGELGRLLRNPTYAGITPEFWRSLDAVCSPSEWRIWGLLNCGKGEPGQSAHVSHGAAPARFRDIEVGIA